MNSYTRFAREALIVSRLLRRQASLRWLKGALYNLPLILRTKSLSPADVYLGEDLEFIAPSRQWLTTSGASFGVVREIFGHQCYASPAELFDARQILDLGGNAGIFSLFALTAAPRSRVVAVEAQPKLSEIITQNVRRNQFADRLEVKNEIVGAASNVWLNALKTEFKNLKHFDFKSYFSRVNRCDFLKCDVEGAEYEIFSGDLDWLRNVHSVALEYHGTWDSGRELSIQLSKKGFSTRQVGHGELGYVFARKNEDQ
jgi:FkbM family methyltransferase